MSTRLAVSMSTAFFATLVVLIALLAAAGYALRLRLAAAVERRERRAAIARYLNERGLFAGGLFVVDEYRTITHVDGEAERLLDASAGALVGRPFDEITEPLVAQLIADIRYARRTGRAVERTQSTADGRTLELTVDLVGFDAIVVVREAAGSSPDPRTRAAFSPAAMERPVLSAALIETAH
jgi:PAS domain-containing protein